MPSPQAAARELLIRRRARSDVLHYVKAIDVPGRPVGDDDDAETEFFRPVETGLAPHHQLLLHKCEQISQTRHGRLMVLMPPGSAKSTYASVVFPSRFLGQKGGRKVILASYGDDLARKMGRRTRSILRQPRYKAIWNCELRADTQAVQEFALTNDSEYLAAGILSGITGNRAHGLIIDDPIKGREQAESQLIRDKTWDAYQDDLLTRLVPGAWVVVIQTRWHEDDLAGRILPESWSGESGTIACRDGNDWEVVCIQAKCDMPGDPLGRGLGEYLWPEWFDAKHWAQFEVNIRTWTSLYQQRPRPIEGAFFRAEQLLVDGRPVPYPPHCDYVFATIDSATKTGRKNDGTGVVFWARNLFVGHPLIVLDWDIQQIEGALLEQWIPGIFRRLEELAALCRARRGSAGAYVEDKASGMILLQQVARMSHEQRRGQVAHAIDSKLTDLGKTERANAAVTYVSPGKVKFSQHAYDKTILYKGATRNHLLSQVLGFTIGSKDTSEDDLLDCFTYGTALALGNDKGI